MIRSIKLMVLKKILTLTLYRTITSSNIQMIQNVKNVSMEIVTTGRHPKFGMITTDMIVRLIILANFVPLIKQKVLVGGLVMVMS